MKMEIQAMLALLMPLTGAQNNKTVTTANGTAAICMKGILLPLLFLLLSDNEAINGSVTASKIRLNAVIKPRTVKKPPITRPGMMYWIAPNSVTSLLVGRKNVTNQAEIRPPSSDQPS